MNQQQLMQRGSAAPQHAGVNADGCGGGGYPYGQDCGGPSWCTDVPYGQLAQSGQIYKIEFRLGFCGAVDSEGRFYTVDVDNTDPDNPTLVYTDQGTSLNFAVANGYYDICGVNVTKGEDVVATLFNNPQNIANIGGVVPMEVWSTDCCYCEFSNCISAANDSELTLEAHVCPSLDSFARQITMSDDTTRMVFISDFALSFIGWLYRTVQGCSTVLVPAPLNQYAVQPPGCAPGLPGPGLGAPGGMMANPGGRMMNPAGRY